MKRTRIMGLCAVAALAAFVLSATATSSASAGTYKYCAAQKKGEYTTATCATKSAKAKKGHFEKVSGRGYTSSTGEAKLETPSLGGTVKCTASKGKGEITGPKTATLQVTFTGCETKGVPCESGATHGTIETFPLETSLIDHGEKGFGGKEPLLGEVWSDIKGESAFGGDQAIFGCEGVGYFRSTGTLAGVAGGVNTMSFTGTQNFENGIGEQD